MKVTMQGTFEDLTQFQYSDARLTGQMMLEFANAKVLTETGRDLTIRDQCTTGVRVYCLQRSICHSAS